MRILSQITTLLTKRNRIMSNTNKTLIVITGPTAVGKTSISIEVAKELNTEIISADARQFYRELKIGTAAPSEEELNKIKHHFIGRLSIEQYYNAYIFENEALKVIDDLFASKDYVVLTGGSGLYIDAVCKGIDYIPDVSAKTRSEVKEIYHEGGLAELRKILQRIDPDYHAKVDLANPKRIMRAIEIYMETGRKLSQFHAESTSKQRPFKIINFILNRPREELFDRINKRACEMIKMGLVEEAWRMFKYRHYNALNTVGYKELFAFFRNVYPLSLAVEKIKTNTRRYAKRQLTWFKKYDDAIWLHPTEKEKIIKTIEKDV